MKELLLHLRYTTKRSWAPYIGGLRAVLSIVHPVEHDGFEDVAFLRADRLLPQDLPRPVYRFRN